MNVQEMSVGDLSEYLNEMIREFYNNNLQPYFDALCDDVMWIGPHTGQVIYGRENLVSAFSAENGQIRYYLGLINTQTVRLSRNSADTVSFFERTAFYPDADPVTFDLCYHLTWVRTDRWKIRVVSIFTQTPKYYEGNLYPIKPVQLRIPKTEMAEAPLRLKEAGTLSTLFIAPSRIQWAESKGRHSILHTGDRDISVLAELRSLAAMLARTHVQCHASYLVNPLHVTDIRRFAVTVTGGRSLPIPEKKYTAVKKRIQELLNKEL